MDVNILIQAIILGIIQGLTEFLPVSSSAHLVIVPLLSKGMYFGKAFDVALHGGTLLAVLLYLQPELKIMFCSMKKCVTSWSLPPKKAPFWQRSWIFLIVSALPAAIVGFALEHYVEEMFHTLPVIAGTLAVFGILMAFADKISPKTKELDEIGVKEACKLGLAQGIALIPGVSRSGIILTAARLLKISPQDCAKISYLMSIPVIGGALIIKALHGFELADNSLIVPLIFAMLFAYISGSMAIELFNKFLTSHNLTYFAIYRVILAAALLWVYFSKIC